MTSFNFSRNQVLALAVLIGVSLLGLTYGRIRSARTSQLKTNDISVTERTGNGRLEIDAPPVRPSALANVRLVVHVAGCVKKSGVYKLEDGSRVVDAIHAAGGPTSEADLDALNLAAKVRDGSQILVPSKQATVPTSSAPAMPPVAATPASSAASAPVQGGQPVNINTAGLAELDQLPGVGPATAQKILAYRNQIGRFSSVDQLMEVKGIGPKKLEKMRLFIRL